MPSEKVLQQKSAQVDELASKISSACAGIIVDYRGITVSDDTALRRELRENGVEYKVVKNTILGRAADKAGLSGVSEVLEGTTAIAVSATDYVAAARILGKFAENSDTFKIKTGFMDGNIIDEAEIKKLANLPSREVLLATVCNVFNAPIAAFARAVQAIVDKAPAEEPKAEVKAEAKAEPKAEVKAEAKEEPKAEEKAEAKEEPKAEETK